MRHITCVVLACLCLLSSGCVAVSEGPIESFDNLASTAEKTQEEVTEHNLIETFPDEENSSENDGQQPTDVGKNLGTIEPLLEPKNTDFVCVTEYIPTIVVELKYATEDNITGSVIYDFTDVYLRYGTVQKLANIQEELLAQGLSLKIWDGYRPVAAQYLLWDAYPVAEYVSNPNNGYSSHSRGNTVDVTLIDADGTELIMPTGFDAFSSHADRNYDDCSAEAKKNALLLETVMGKYGFRPYFAEWWHFTDIDAYPVEKSFVPKNPA